MIHDTHMSQYIPCTLFHFSTATITETAGAVAGTIALNRANVNQTTLMTIPIIIPSNTESLKGSYLKSVEIDYEVFTGEPTSLTWTINKVTRNADGTAPTVDVQAKTDLILAADSHAVDQHKQTLTLTAGFWIDHNEYVLVECSLVAGAGANTEKFASAVANYTLRM
jgi:hypothetical protein